MRVEKYPFTEIPFLSKTDITYQTDPAIFSDFFAHPPELESFAPAIEKRKSFSTDRDLLVSALREQYKGIEPHPKVKQHIKQLADENVYTVVTAHQPALCTGPLYVIYKIFSAINLAESLNGKYPDSHFVPVFVTGGEDHDFEEINHFHCFGETVEWQNSEKGSVGRMSTQTLAPVLKWLEENAVKTLSGKELCNLMKEAYTAEDRYGLATQRLIHELFKEWGLLTLNMDSDRLKSRMKEVFRDDLIHHSSKKLVEAAQSRLDKMGFSAQAFPREINLFHLTDNHRERIEKVEDQYIVLNTDLRFNQKEILAELDSHAGRFSPNVILRPIYQETILPNVAYVGGGGELAYWLERKSQFEHFDVPMPVLIRRSSVMWISQNIQAVTGKLDMEIPDFFTQDEEEIVQNQMREHNSDQIVLNGEIEEMRSVYAKIVAKVKSVDSTLEYSALAAEARMMKILEQLEQKMMRATKKRESVTIERINRVTGALFPKRSLQERRDNLVQYVMDYGWEFLDVLKEHIDPLDKNFLFIYE